MANVPVSTIRLFDQYSIPVNENNQFFCPYCYEIMKRNRRDWINHLNQYHKKEFNLILDGFRAINRGIQSIADDTNQNDMINYVSFHFVNETEASSAQKEVDNESFEVQLGKLIEAKKNGDLNDQEFFAEVEKLYATKCSS